MTDSPIDHAELPQTLNEKFLDKYGTITANINGLLAFYVALGIMLLTMVLTRFALSLCICLDVFNKTAGQKAKATIKKAKSKKLRTAKSKPSKSTKSTTTKSKSTKKSEAKKTKKPNKQVGTPKEKKSTSQRSKSEKSLKSEKSTKSSITKKLKQKINDITAPSAFKSNRDKPHPKPLRRESSSSSIKAASLEKDISLSRARAKVVSFAAHNHNESTTQKFQKASTHWVAPPSSTDGRLYKSDDCPTPNPFKPIPSEKSISKDSNPKSTGSISKKDPFEDSVKASQPLSPTTKSLSINATHPHVPGKIYNPNQVPAQFKTDNVSTAKAWSPTEKIPDFPIKENVTAPMVSSKSPTDVTPEKSVQSSTSITDMTTAPTTLTTTDATKTTASKTAPLPSSQTQVTLKDLAVPSPAVAPTPPMTDPTQSPGTDVSEKK